MQTPRLITIPVYDLMAVMMRCCTYHWAQSATGLIYNTPQPGIRVADKDRETPCILAANEVLQERGAVISCGSLREAAFLLGINYESAFYLTMHASYVSGEQLHKNGGGQHLWSRFFNPKLREVLASLCD